MEINYDDGPQNHKKSWDFISRIGSGQLSMISICNHIQQVPPQDLVFYLRIPLKSGIGHTFSASDSIDIA